MLYLPSLLQSVFLKMNSNNKLGCSGAIRAEVRRHESVQHTFNRLFKQFERVGDQQLRSGLKVYLHSIQGIVSFPLSTVVHCVYIKSEHSNMSFRFLCAQTELIILVGLCEFFTCSKKVRKLSHLYGKFCFIILNSGYRIKSVEIHHVVVYKPRT